MTADPKALAQLLYRKANDPRETSPATCKDAADLITRLTAQLAEAEARADRNAAAVALEASARQEAEAEVGGLLGILENCSVESGICCCGDNMETHPEPMSCGHSPVDSGEYAYGQWLERHQALASEPKS